MRELKGRNGGRERDDYGGTGLYKVEQDVIIYHGKERGTV